MQPLQCALTFISLFTDHGFLENRHASLELVETKVVSRLSFFSVNTSTRTGLVEEKLTTEAIDLALVQFSGKRLTPQSVYYFFFFVRWLIRDTSIFSIATY